MAKRKRLDPTRRAETQTAQAEPQAPRPSLAARPPIADVAHDAAASAALSELAGELSAARSEGRLVQVLPLATVAADYLVRDRAELDYEALEALAASIAARGQQTPIEVVDLGNRRYGLISGYRRLAALKMNEAQTVRALVRPPTEMAEAYRAMVEENEIRENLSFWERGRIVIRAVEAGVFRGEKAALGSLYAHVPRARRSKIGRFAELVRQIDGFLTFPTRLTEKQGLALARYLEAHPDKLDLLMVAVKDNPDVKTPEDEAAIIAAFLSDRLLPGKPAAPTDVVDRQELAPGLSLQVTRAGVVTLRGPQLDRPGLRDHLVDALRRAVRDFPA